MFLINFFRKKKPKLGEFCNISLKSSSLSVSVHNSIVLMTLTQSFKNEESSPLEVNYSFPRMKDSALVSLIVKFSDGSILTTKIHEKNEALELYQDSISQGNTAMIASQKKSSRLVISIGNLSRDTEIQVELKVTFPVSWEGSMNKILIPAEFFSDSDLVKNFSLDFELNSSRQISKYSSNLSNEFKLSQDKLRLAGKVTSFKTDLVVCYLSQDIHVPSCLFQRLGNHFYAMVSVVPAKEDLVTLQDAEGLGEFIFVLDRSGSMNGSNIDLAKQAAILFIKSLPDESFFNVVSFGSQFELMFKASILNTSENVDLALEKIKKFDADMGGTNIFEPLKKIFKREAPDGYSKIVFLLTDGQVDNKSKVIKLIKNNRIKVNSFGIGYGFDKDLIEKTAEAGKGIPNFVKNVEEIGEKVISTLTKCLIPALSNWQVLWNGENHPEKFGSINYGDRFAVYSKLEELPRSSVTIRAFDSGLKSFRELELSDFQETNENIYKLWAFNKIWDLEKSKNKQKDEIIQISIESGVPSSFTSLFCEIVNKEAVVGEMKIVKIQRHIIQDYTKDCEKTKSFSPFGNLFSKKSTASSAKKQNMIVCRSSSRVVGAKSHKFEKACKVDLPDFHLPKRSSEDRKVEIPSIKLEFINLISLQRSAGFWNYSDFVNDTELLSKIPKDFIQCDEVDNALCTLMVLAYLTVNFEQKYAEWVLIEKKALKWLSNKNLDYRVLEKQLLRFL